MKNKEIIPTVFSLDKKEFQKKFKKVVRVANKIQIDFMDGKFVSAKSVSLSEISNLKKYKKEFEAHLMVFHPERLFEECKKKGFKRVIFHIEAVEEPREIINYARKLKLEVYVAINPSTPQKKIEKIVKGNLADGILLLGVHPGKEGQKLSFKIPGRIRKIKKMNSSLTIQIDGGVNDKNILKLSRAGADFVNSGSFVSGSKNPKKQIELLERKFNERNNFIRQV